MKKNTLIIVLIVTLVAGLAILYSSKPDLFQGSAFKKFDQNTETLPGEEPIVTP